MKISVGDIRLFVEIDGRPLPPLFLMHGGPGANHLRLKRDLAYLRQWFQLIFIDTWLRSVRQMHKVHANRCAKRRRYGNDPRDARF